MKKHITLQINGKAVTTDFDLSEVGEQLSTAMDALTLQDGAIKYRGITGKICIGEDEYLVQIRIDKM
jgi:hypothetical protein